MSSNTRQIQKKTETNKRTRDRETQESNSFKHESAWNFSLL